MSRTVDQVTQDDIAVYRETFRRRREARAQARRERMDRAWRLAESAAELLRTRFGASRVVVYGSLARESDFDEHSDVDLAAWGVRAEDWLDASDAVLVLGDDVEVNLAPGERLRPAVLQATLQEGRELL